ncbi:class I SAM-dependent methyltransferase [Caulobacter vibrioides]|uniref:Methyltransferase n=1 Tax=Caulobacter vibrioides (strain NA1000 / CB15N) TaxID=565050 RepID=A0A0H3C9K3_CAUVN|nr:class I SAM-dependent methyltransferase [Caulobacter vibrioides]YP_002517712.1 class I SAM-dependent methyltransferase [Caulobacter vibrioides NA1000]ACL95804.1 class I SAM-dependent methyltransferase [Caulobacter vibrioides NA1000]ATC29120.1 methyltransferase [Caulobacter vibrioides]QXZ50634.1 class I SAM-dependent methyltransferase [Caulobacter vibrioides]
MMIPVQLWSRRSLVAGVGALALASCGKKDDPAKVEAKAAAKAGPNTIEAAVAGNWRPPADRARDVWRHPVESLKFWELKPGQTVVEFWPGAGWYTDILAPFLADTRGKLYEAMLETTGPADPAAATIVDGYRRKLAEKKKVYGEVAFTAFGPTSGPVAPAGSADLVLFLRNLHNWMAGGIAEKAFKDALAALKPGGILGIEEHRGQPGRVQDVLAEDGYVQQDYVIQMAKEAGFILIATSEINANPKDTKDHPFGVWTLPPTRLSAPRGEPAEPGFDHSKYDAIGESDRMTLKFAKPK